MYRKTFAHWPSITQLTFLTEEISEWCDLTQSLYLSKLKFCFILLYHWLIIVPLNKTVDTWCSYWQLFPVTVHLRSGLRPINTLCTHKHRTQILSTETLFSFWYKQFQFIPESCDLQECEMHVFLLRFFLHPEWMSLLPKHVWTFVSRLFLVICYLVLNVCRSVQFMSKPVSVEQKDK